jgi:hypothetical protein
MENDQIPDPYDAVLTDLRAKKAQIEATIALLESLRATGVPPLPGSAPLGAGLAQKPKDTPSEVGPGAFFGMTVHDAAIKVLQMRRRELQTTEIVAEIERGGIRMTSSDKTNTVGSILLRRFYNVGDLVRVGRGRWGLQEWYPGRKFPKGKGGENNKGDEQDANDVGNEQETAASNPFAVRMNPHLTKRQLDLGPPNIPLGPDSDIHSAPDDSDESIIG